jgi:serine O-acetyltransferase
MLNYIKFCLESNFINYPRKSLTSLKPYYKEAINQALFDANSRYLKTKKLLNKDDLISYVQIDPRMEAVLFYRLERAIFLHDPNNPLLPYLASSMRRRTGAEIYYSTEIGMGFLVQHGFGIVIGPRYKIGDNFSIYQGVTLGQKNQNCPDERIVIGDNVSIFSGAVILGNINIGNNARIGANSVLLCNVEENSIYAGIPAKKVK